MIVKSSLPSYLTQRQVRQFFAVITSPRDRALFTTIYLYGLRVSEACCLDRGDLDLDRSKIRILRAKNGIPGEKPIPTASTERNVAESAAHVRPVTAARKS